MRRPVVDPEQCIGSATCASVCPEVFKLDLENKSSVLPGVDYEQYEKKIEEAIKLCPVAAIRWEEYQTQEYQSGEF
ncbi:MAG: ferredoxin [Patescibacteria group bacterium]|nr:ferredoxin [Patescibacteria group bacterium]